MERNQKKRREEAEAEKPQWERAMKRWNKLYYCMRDNGVFIPDEGEFVPVEQMEAHLIRKYPETL